MDVSSTATIKYQKQSYQVSALIENHGVSQYSQQSVSFSATKETFTLSLSDVNQSLNVLYEEAIAALNVELEGVYGSNSIQNAYGQGIDFSPEATAE